MSQLIKTAEDIEGMRLAGRLAAQVLDYISPFVKPGISTEELDQLCHRYIVDDLQAIPAPSVMAVVVAGLHSPSLFAPLSIMWSVMASPAPARF